MNIFKRIYCRIFQLGLRIALPVLPYRTPKPLDSQKELCDVLVSSGHKRPLLVTGKGIRALGLTDALIKELSEAGIDVVVYDGTVANPTTDNVDEALSLYLSKGCDCLIAFGGGSAMDCAKATGARVACPKKPLIKMKGILKVRKKLPLFIAIPTTAGTGSETTLAAVITDSKTRHKYAINDFPLIPRYAMLDARLTENLPKSITSTTGMDALTHAIEAYIGKSTTKETRTNAIEAIKLIFANLETCYNDGHDLEARQNMLKAAYLAGLAFTKSYVGYVHAIAHSLGGKYNLPHGLANAIILPHVLKSYGKAVHKKLWKIGVKTRLFDENTPIDEGAKLLIKKIEAMNESMGIGTSISEIDERDIPALSRIAEKEANPLYPVPKLYTAKQLERLYLEVKNG